ncbi:Hypothetical predicted protein [Olea europaea subsp. europaea]|uniref:Uncharacterized protein n=1 Tax=Olea europaea subsp. europaea TaxID=158383 RepID=A0A8S0RF24_OLEEU|nr:Hypothetical predicted protein [Olea europaea subsp. europaea]
MWVYGFLLAGGSNRRGNSYQEACGVWAHAGDAITILIMWCCSRWSASLVLTPEAVESLGLEKGAGDILKKAEARVPVLDNQNSINKITADDNLALTVAE